MKKTKKEMKEFREWKKVEANIDCLPDGLKEMSRGQLMITLLGTLSVVSVMKSILRKYEPCFRSEDVIDILRCDCPFVFESGLFVENIFSDDDGDDIRFEQQLGSQLSQEIADSILSKSRN